MTSNKCKTALLAALAALCLLLGACSSGTPQAEEPSEYAVDIVVPYATSTPKPQTESGSAEQPLSISPNGDVTLSDKSWIDSGFAPAALEEAENYYTQLRLGDSGTEVRKLQARLQELSYYQGEVSGVFDSATEEAVKLFELSYGSMQTGIATARMQTLLYSDKAPTYNSSAYITSLSGNYTVLEYGDTGPAVYALQERLRNLGYPIWDVTGIYDDATVEAVHLFYRAYNTDESDSASVALQQELYSEGAKGMSSSTQITLAPGNQGTVVSDIQETLISLGYLEGEATGTYDDETTDAVRSLQHDIGQEETGRVSPALRNLLLKQEFASAEDLANGIALNGTLRQGAKGEKVLQLQRRLIELGYPYVSVTGVFDDDTALAISSFQGVAGLEQTGMASLALQDYLYSDNATVYRLTEELLDSDAGQDLGSTVFSFGSSGEGVVELQSRLHALGYLKGAITGEFDNKTENAVRLLQAAIGVSQNGVVSSTMLLYLNSNVVPKSGISFYDETPPALIRLTLDSSGDEVTALQRKLWDLGFLSTEGVHDSIGTYNEATQEAVSSAQKAMGYQETDGIASVEFQAFLYSRYSDRIKAE